jgi:hypothetical protein
MEKPHLIKQVTMFSAFSINNCAKIFYFFNTGGI